MSDDIFSESNEEIELLEEILAKAVNYFPSTKTPLHLVKLGMMEYDGVLVPISSVSHKLTYENFEKVFFDTFRALFSRIYKEKNSYSTEFAFRTLLDMGIGNSFLLFNDQVSKEDRNKYVLTSLLADYFGFRNSEEDVLFKDWFDNLYRDYSSYLTTIEQTDFSNLVNYQSPDERARNVKKARKMAGKIRDDLLNKYQSQGKFSKSINLDMIGSGYSHTLHGNVFLIENMVKDSSFRNHLFRVHSNLTISGMEFLRNLAIYTNDDKFRTVVDQFILHNNQFRKKFELAWANNHKIIDDAKTIL